MSMKGISSAEPNKLSKIISPHKRNEAHSGELDVFEAAVYFSGYNEVSSGDHRYTQKYGYNAAREESRRRWGILGGGRRISLDLPIRCSEQVHHLYQDQKHEVTTIKERIGNVRHKQPSSPGGKIASFLNSLFHQAGSKKNKSKSKPTDREVEEEISGGGWMKRRRRSSISHFLSSSRSNSTTTTTSSSSKSLFSSSSSGFRSPPPYLNTPTKNYKQFLNYTSATNQVEVEEKKINKELSWLDEKLKVMESLSEKKKVWADHDDDDNDDDDRRTKREGDDDDDGMESDSSSDLFELQNYELSRGGLPVYETTNVANINNTHL
ncbi:hypothetical protein EUTSA_v10018878mg [Eutrema salsugineum]|uniref:Protein BIG GRAIN 1-like E n=1 Tax=Eutrema salsugineum TaxID=72664 RepID=V4MAW4_EUTSA|nr:protein BIG GRAIN 1-like E [Eutrema salsugineum]ESQ28341.1 hypothetical protein EUTSA_v10018878mg [Eutrema salsugineum]